MTISDWMIVCATLLGPIIAVQVQKAVEAAREGRGQKRWVFHQLMTTRAAPLSPQHVQALNMIDLAFYGKGPRRKAKEQRVIDLWKEHMDHLSDRALQDRDPDAWHDKLQDSHVNLLMSIADDVGYAFDRVQLRKGAYNPQAHGMLEHEQTQLRRLAIAVLEGRNALTMNVASFPVDEDALQVQAELSNRLAAALADGSLKVQVSLPSTTSRQA